MKLWRCVWITARGAIADGKVTLYSHSTQQSHHSMSSTRPLKMDTYVFHTLTADLFIPQHLVIPGIQHRREMTVHLMSDVSKTLMCHSYEIIIAYWIPPASGPKGFFCLISAYLKQYIYFYERICLKCEPVHVLMVNIFMKSTHTYARTHTHTHKVLLNVEGPCFQTHCKVLLCFQKRKNPLVTMQKNKICKTCFVVN